MSRVSLRSLFALVALLSGLVAGCRGTPSWERILDRVRADFPEVEQVSTGELAARLAGEEPLLLLDVRQREEHAVSHLPGAILVDPDGGPEDLPPGLARDAPIVTYCSVGYRSSAFARRLQEAGFTRVANLEGSIFRWANEGRPVFRDGREVREVHPFDETWGELLAPPLRTYRPREAPGAAAGGG